MTQPQSSPQRLENLVLVLLAVICVSISFVQTAVGYEELAGSVFTWLFSLVISLFILLLNYRFREALRLEYPVAGILLFFVVVVGFSFAGNFNAFYSQFMRKELYEDELNAFKSKLTGIQEKAVTALNNSHDAEALKAKVLQARDKLVLQITDKGNPGIGDRAREIIRELEGYLGRPLTILVGSSNEEQAQLMAQQIDRILAQEIPKRSDKANQLVRVVNSLADSAKTKTDYVLSSPYLLEKYGKETLNELAAAHNDIGQKTLGYLGEDKFSFNEIQSRNAQVGKISASFQSAMRGDNNQATFIAAVASLAVDLLVPLYILLTAKRDGGGDWNSPRRNRRRQGIRTLE
jgi:hypothetical protein